MSPVTSSYVLVTLVDCPHVVTRDEDDWTDLSPMDESTTEMVLVGTDSSRSPHGELKGKDGPTTARTKCGV